MTDVSEVERVARAMRPNLFRLYPHGASNIHEETRNMARAAIAAIRTAEPHGVVEALRAELGQTTDALERLTVAATKARKVMADGGFHHDWTNAAAGIDAALAKATASGDREVG